VRSAFRRRTSDAETLEELADHVERQTRKHIAAGMDVHAAERLARIELGGVQRWREETAGTRPGAFIDALVADARFAFRGLRKRPVFSCIAILTLALGLGAGSAALSIVEGALLRPLPFPNADRLMVLWLRMPLHDSATGTDMVWSYPKFAFFRDHQTVFSSLALHSPETMSISESGGTQRISGETATSSYFTLLGTRPEIGRTFSAAEESPGGPPVALISDAFWRSHLGATPNPLGRTVNLGGTKRIVVGVLPPGFRGLSGDAEVWVPIVGARSTAVLEMSDAHNLELLGLLTPGVTRDAAQHAVAIAGDRIDAAYPSDDGHWGARIQPLDDLRIAPSTRRALVLLAAAVVLMLAIVCVNLVTLFLTRGLARRAELALRAAVGASRGRVTQQVVTESTMLALIGAVLGLLIGYAGHGYFASALSAAIPGTERRAQLTRVSFSMIHFGPRTVFITLAAALVIGVVIGVVTTARVTRQTLTEALRQASQGRATPTTPRTLLVAQIALAVLLLVMSGLTVQSLRHILQIPLGFQVERLISVSVTLDPARTTRETPQSLWHAILDEVDGVPGVISAAVGSCAPVGDHCDGSAITPQGHRGATHVSYHEVSPGYFGTLGTPVLRGREFAATDAAGAMHVAIINRAAAREIWGGDDPLTTPLIGSSGTTRIVGIVADARYEDPERPAVPAVFFASEQTGTRHAFLIVRTAGDPAAFIGSVREAIRRAGSGHAIGSVRAVSSQLSDATTRNRLIATVVTCFAIAALLLAALGIYGSLSLTVMQRSRELAIRRALGAERRSLVVMVISQIAKVGVYGAASGVLLAWIAARAASSLLYDTRPLEPAAYLVASLLLVCTVAAAAVVPSVKSMRADPRDAMRSDT
jgi:predicted permease